MDRSMAFSMIEKGQNMENQITCPRCKKMIANHPVINAAAKSEGTGSDFITCECGERITYWAITAQLREQKTFSSKVQNWLQKTFSRG
jgi:hypothetical protein